MAVQDENRDQEGVSRMDGEVCEQGPTLGNGEPGVRVDPNNTQHMRAKQRRRRDCLDREVAGRIFWGAVVDLFLREIGEQETTQEPKVPVDISNKEEDNKLADKEEE